MEGEQELSSSSEQKLLTLSELADELCSYYMSIGVSYDEYWHGDYTQLRFYRKAFEIKQERDNRLAWVQGGYFYDALCAVSPILNAFAKRGTKPIPYLKEPYPLQASEESETSNGKTPEELQEIQALNASARFASVMTQWNKEFIRKGGEVSGINN